MLTSRAGKLLLVELRPRWIRLLDAQRFTGLSKMIADKLMIFQDFSPIVTVSCLCFAASLLTEVTSNTAICSIMLPVVAQIAVAIG